jgi:S-adenosylmethionine:tRNA ribosyltransferase-isomerase
MMINIDLNEYKYDLPSERIAQYPLNERDGSKILVYRDGNITENSFSNLDEYIPSGSLLVFNNTKVIKARLVFNKDSGARIEILCLEPVLPGEYTSSLNSRDKVEWRCMIGNLKKWKSGTIRTGFRWNNNDCELFAQRLNREGDEERIMFSWNCASATFAQVIEAAGHTPLPPYIDRPDEEEDNSRYQTIYSMVQGSVAGPTAGLHFTRNLLDKLYRNGIMSTELTLHVSAGTFQPIKSDNILSHLMHSEHFFVTADTIETLLKYLDSIVAVGTTSVRTLESLYWMGVKLLSNPEIEPHELFLDQWEAYSLPDSIPSSQSLEALLLWMHKHKVKTIHAPTRILIIPGYIFQMMNGLITNFHLPGSTLLLLISAWVGTDWKKIYNYALNNNFRFLSYGDGSLLFR